MRMLECGFARRLRQETDCGPEGSDYALIPRSIVMPLYFRGCRMVILALAAAAWPGLAAGLRAQTATPLTLAEAVSIALEKNPLRKGALADSRAAQAGVREARSGLFPRLMFSEGGFRSNDPVFVFGTKLRQHRFTLDDFSGAG